MTILTDFQALLHCGRPIVCCGGGDGMYHIFERIKTMYGSDFFSGVVCIADNSEQKQGTIVHFDIFEFPVCSVEDALSRYDNPAILLTTIQYCADFITQIAQLPISKHADVWTIHELWNPKPYAVPDITQNAVVQIPKKIHYIWVGGRKLDAERQKCVESWHKYHSDWEITEWNESNYDFGKNEYLKGCYSSRAYAYATRYVRCDVVHQYGGVYLDTDVEIIKPLDRLLYDKVFFVQSYWQIVSGNGFGAIKGHPILQEIMDVCEAMDIRDKSTLKTSTPFSEIYHRYGWDGSNTLLSSHDVVFYPSDVINSGALTSPTGEVRNIDNTQNTFALHRYLSAKNKYSL